MSTPLYDALLAFSAQAPLRMHMPGHKGALHPLDVTELAPTGNLYEAGGAIEQAQQLWAQAVGLAHGLFLTNGSTAGIFAALSAACPLGSEVLLDRDCHLAFHHAMATLDLQPQFMRRALHTPVTAQQVADAMQQHPNAKTVCITSPTYYGVLSNIAEISAVVHANGGVLLVDGAHGAHLPFLLGREVYEGADLLVLSAHKTLRAYGQSALLLSSPRFDMDTLRRHTRIFQTSSPSYLLMAQLDVARAWMQGEGLEAYRRVAQWNRWSLGDPTRAVIVTDGIRWAKQLEEQNIFAELYNRDHVVFILSDADREEDLQRLEQAIAAAPAPLPPLTLELPAPERLCAPRAAVFAPQETLPLAQAEGRIAAAPVAPYPPGIPIVAPGEEIDKKTIAYLQKIMYNESVRVVK